MREKLNDNPVMQLVVIGVLIVLVGFFFMTRMKGSSSEPPADPAATTPAATDPATGAPATTDPATGAPVATDPAAAAAAGTVPAAAPPISATTSEFKAGPGLPKPVVNAYNGGDAVALLITKQKGVDDKAMRKHVSAIRGKNDVALFTVRVHDVADYSQIAQGVDLDRVPALVVIQPKKFAGKSAPPEATVTYGFRTPQSVAQAVDDALDDLKDKGYSPG